MGTKNPEVLEMVGEEWLNLEEFELPAPEELVERPPIKAKIVKIEPRKEKSRFRDGEDINIHIYAITDRGWIQHIIYRYSTHKNSKFGQFILKVYELTKNDPEIQKPIKLSNLIGTTWTWEYKERQLGNVISAFWLPVEYHGKEPVTAEEIQAVEEWINERQQAEQTPEEIGKEVEKL